MLLTRIDNDCSDGIRAGIVLLKLCAQRNETETKQFQNCFETVLFQFHFVVRSADSLRNAFKRQIWCLRVTSKAMEYLKSAF